ncbi:uncharacterized protein TNCV_4329421 [Trichonephila clavipes]|nr:uncharacterized protein TNCV_4329421 [Trichonephila clavipes]
MLTLATISNQRIRHPGGSAKDGHVQPRVPMSDICPCAHEGKKPQIRLNSDPPLLLAPKGWYQDQPFGEGSTNEVFMMILDHSGLDAYPGQETNQRMQWPARSLELNSIEHVQDALGRRVAYLNPHPWTLVTLAFKCLGR